MYTFKSKLYPCLTYVGPTLVAWEEQTTKKHDARINFMAEFLG